MRNPFWGKDSATFRPERFENIKPADVRTHREGPTPPFISATSKISLTYIKQITYENSQPQLRYNLFAFGFGARKCLGQHDAERAIKALVFHLLDRYEMKVLPNQSKDGDYKVDEGNWVPLSDVELELKKLDRFPKI